ncbi:MAG TPA: polyprenyl synthetase family protein [Anaerolineaceae bacterium]|nr:polyprenyl synthetase family protein [Anaerolineaceae bacterium]
MTLQSFTEKMRPAIEDELFQSIDRALSNHPNGLREMLAYHLGWEGQGAGPEAQGKRIRPLLALLCSVAAGGDWESALPAAAGIELIHNFSLIHDDIQDQSQLRRGRPTVWVKWGIPQAINAGDLMFTIAHMAVLEVGRTKTAQVTLDASSLLHQACVDLTKGQYLDLAYENEKVIPLEGYWPMVAGKTAALLACSTEIGALLAGCQPIRRKAFRQFGYSLGLAFQVLDDWLGIWGDTALTGKSVENDLVSGKKTLPVLYGISQKKKFAERWISGSISPDEVTLLAKMLEDEGAQAYTDAMADQLTGDALVALDAACDQNEAAFALHELANQLLRRNK